MYLGSAESSFYRFIIKITRTSRSISAEGLPHGNHPYNATISQLRTPSITTLIAPSCPKPAPRQFSRYRRLPDCRTCLAQALSNFQQEAAQITSAIAKKTIDCKDIKPTAREGVGEGSVKDKRRLIKQAFCVCREENGLGL